MEKQTTRAIDLIVIHCSANKEGSGLDAAYIDREHKKRGWSRIGYHYVIKEDGNREIGRKESEVGAHAYGYNKNSIGICYIGGLDSKGKPKDTRTEAQENGILDLLEELRAKYPDAKILGHRDLSPDIDGDGVIEPWEWMKACPCFDAVEQYQKI